MQYPPNKHPHYFVNAEKYRTPPPVDISNIPDAEKADILRPHVERIHDAIYYLIEDDWKITSIVESKNRIADMLYGFYFVYRSYGLSQKDFYDTCDEIYDPTSVIHVQDYEWDEAHTVLKETVNTGMNPSQFPMNEGRDICRKFVAILYCRISSILHDMDFYLAILESINLVQIGEEEPVEEPLLVEEPVEDFGDEEPLEEEEVFEE